MAVPKQHRSKSRQGQRRMHLFIKNLKLVACKKCGKPVLPHTLCENCGTYRSKTFLDVLAKLTKKERKQKQKELAAQEEHPPAGGQSKDLSAEELSKR
ncbi:MAG: 50S ribosomal protein L32 [Candidatus Wildermuthbacteria bacterium]|nr:50S ribosomal protein L32 [Candidatus Wildermuthbacteria bacterium]